MLKKVIGWALIVLLVYFVVTNPASASATAHSIWSGVASLGAGLGNFLGALAGGHGG